MFKPINVRILNKGEHWVKRDSFLCWLVSDPAPVILTSHDGTPGEARDITWWWPWAGFLLIRYLWCVQLSAIIPGPQTLIIWAERPDLGRPWRGKSSLRPPWQSEHPTPDLTPGSRIQRYRACGQPSWPELKICYIREKGWESRRNLICGRIWS